MEGSKFMSSQIVVYRNEGENNKIGTDVDKNTERIPRMIMMMIGYAREEMGKRGFSPVEADGSLSDYHHLLHLSREPSEVTGSFTNTQTTCPVITRVSVLSANIHFSYVETDYT